jgi:predicted transglutaminase-like cysteine proteinase
VGPRVVHACLRRAYSVAPKLRNLPGAFIFAATVLSAPAHAEDPISHANASVQRPAPGNPIVIYGRSRPTVPSVFGTVAVPFGTTPVSARWTRVMTASVSEAALSSFIAGARGLAPYQQVAFVQSAVNRAVRARVTGPCRFDDGYWASARETLTRGFGDCVDIAVAKVEALRQLGFTTNDLYLLTGRMFSGGLEAGLLVRIGDQFLFLDARSDQAVEASRMASFTPVVTYGVGMTWAHGVPVGGPRKLNNSPPVPIQSAQRVDEPRPLGGFDDVKSAVRSLTPSK